jgi:hypothetical protein
VSAPEVGPTWWDRCGPSARNGGGPIRRARSARPGRAYSDPNRCPTTEMWRDHSARRVATGVSVRGLGSAATALRGRAARHTAARCHHLSRLPVATVTAGRARSRSAAAARRAARAWQGGVPVRRSRPAARGPTVASRRIAPAGSEALLQPVAGRRSRLPPEETRNAVRGRAVAEDPAARRAVP